MSKKKLSLEEIKDMPPSFFLMLINKMKKKLMNDEVMKNIFKEYGVDIKELEYYPMKFGELDVSAKTDHGIVIFSYKLLLDGDFIKDYSYAIHEVTHVLQQTCRDKPTKSSDAGSYLDNPFEEEAFQNQVEYISNEYGDNEAKKYVNNLLDHHEVEDKDKRKDKKEELLSKI